MPEVYDRIAGRRSATIRLDNTFYKGGVPTDPYAIRRVEIFKGKVAPENLVDAIDIADLDSSSYPSPLVKTCELDGTGGTGSGVEQCQKPGSNLWGDCTEDAQGSDPCPGAYTLLYDIPCDFIVPDVYFDVWFYHGENPFDCGCGTGGSSTDISDCDDLLLTTCNKFWVYADNWYANGGLSTIRLGFEPLDTKFNKPEVRPLEVGIMPLPLYDYDWNLVAPIIPYSVPTITIKTQTGELVVSEAPAKIKTRQGSYRSNPWVISYDLNTCDFFAGTYDYRVILTLPDGSSRVSPTFNFTVK